MSKLPIEKPEYGNWVSMRLLYIPFLISVFLGGLSFLFPVIIIPAIIFFLCFVYFAYARWMFSSRGGDIQARIKNLLLRRLPREGVGKVIDIGCGSASLTIEVAKQYPSAEVTGIDNWGKAWEYSLELCEKNAQIEEVTEQVTFHKASAAALPFDDEFFDLAVSNLVFHEVHSVRDKSELIKEALRVVKKGGHFAFQDLFLWKAVYGEIDALLETIRSWGITKVEFVPTNDSDFIPKALKLPFMVGTVSILHGEK